MCTTKFDAQELLTQLQLLPEQDFEQWKRSVYPDEKDAISVLRMYCHDLVTNKPPDGNICQ